ncbi:hypothetical protein NSQ59_27160 [Margalitia sp. FSL K6-0131]|uniref:hypothetical protein n=1 Tax=Margalitia sp. FSL K6-0131 TaxID=2954604 RepID=UPI0030F8E978
MKKYKVCLHKKDTQVLERDEQGSWFLDGVFISTEQAINELVDAVQDLGYWCQVAKNVLPTENFEMVQEAYEHHED